jgi:hypothetical protein
MKATTAEMEHNGSHNHPAFAGHPSIPEGAMGALPKEVDITIGASNCDTDTPRLPKPPL